MKIIEKDKNVFRAGVQKSTECGMILNAKAFEMLARQYSNPIKAILQEIGANAADSHIRAGIPDRPFDVKLPNALDPHLRIRDYGIGMAREVIYNTYINYMKSDKTDTNSETGCFGIGSKTPLAYTDSFNIKTYTDGKMHLYTLGYNEKGIPELNEFAAHDTDEENGVEISFAVRSDDFRKFEETAAKVYSFFSTVPNVTGTTSFELKTYKKVLEGSNWYIYNSDDRDYGSYVLMGNIAYPISNEDLSLPYADKSYGIINSGVVISVPIGSVSMTPSRESLEFNDGTIKFLTQELKNVGDEISEEGRKLIDAADNMWDARIVSSKLHKALGWRSSDLVNLNYWRGTNLPHYADVHVFAKFNNEHGKVRRRNDVQNTVPIGERKCCFVIKDMDTKFDVRCRYLASTTGKTVYLIEEYREDTTVPLYDHIKKKVDCSEEVAKELIFKVSELEHPPTKRVVRTGIGRKTTTTVMEFDIKGNRRDYGKRYESRYWSQVEVDLTEEAGTHYYIEWNNYEYSSEGSEFEFLNIIKGLSRLGIPIPKIYGVKNAQKNKISKQSNWKPFLPWVQKLIKGRYDNEEFHNAIRENKILERLDIAHDVRIIKEKATKTIEDKDSPFSKLINLAFVRKDNAEKVEEMKQILRLSRFAQSAIAVDKNCKENDEIDDLVTECEKRYALPLEFIRTIWIKDESIANQIIESINALDFYHNNK